MTQLRAQLASHLAKTKAQRNSLNPAYDPAKASQAGTKAGD